MLVLAFRLWRSRRAKRRPIGTWCRTCEPYYRLQAALGMVVIVVLAWIVLSGG